jgi:hypothetical protein
MKAGAARRRKRRQNELPKLVLRSADDPLVDVLRRASRLVLQHPIAAQAAFAALVAEGRRFAGTPDGSRWKAALAGSELVRGARVVWESSVLNVLEDDPDTLLPSVIVDAIVEAASRADLPGLLREVHVEDDGAGA